MKISANFCPFLCTMYLVRNYDTYYFDILEHFNENRKNINLTRLASMSLQKVKVFSNALERLNLFLVNKFYAMFRGHSHMTSDF